MKKKLFLSLALFGFVCISGIPTAQASSRYQLDVVHSTVGFAVKHMLFSTLSLQRVKAIALLRS